MGELPGWQVPEASQQPVQVRGLHRWLVITPASTQGMTKQYQGTFGIPVTGVPPSGESGLLLPPPPQPQPLASSAVISSRAEERTGREPSLGWSRLVKCR